MNVSDLIELLSALPPNAHVDIDYTGYYEADIDIAPRLALGSRRLKDHHNEPVVYLATVDANP